MKDKVSQQRVLLLHPKFIPLVTAFINDAEANEGIILRIVQGLRTFAEQDAIYAQGRTKPGKIVTWAPAGTSYHNYGLAVDTAPIIKNGTALDWNYNFKKLRKYATKYGITWGGDFPKGKTDLDHFENKFGRNWRDLLDMYHKKDFIPGTSFINL
jgi:peptidoglycan L-alanyl-D-glutamate endopeptidase CwlK